MRHPAVSRIVSGGQTGVDRAALDAAISLGIPHGGWCPKGRKAEDGAIDDCYELRETEDAYYVRRTEQNVIDSDATLILTVGPPTGGTRKTVEFAVKHDRPRLVLDVSSAEKGDIAEQIRKWLLDGTGGEGGAPPKATVLNVAGPRESKHPDIHQKAYDLLCLALGDGVPEDDAGGEVRY